MAASEYKFALSKRTVKKGGKVIFTISNKGTEVHDFKVVGKIPKSRFITGGQKTTLTLTFKKAGRTSTCARSASTPSRACRER